MVCGDGIQEQLRSIISLRVDLGEQPVSPEFWEPGV